MQKILGYSLYAILRALSLLPYSWKLILGKQLGLLLYYVYPSRKRVVRANVNACFPHWTDLEKRRLVKENYIHTGQGAMETIHSWWCNLDDILANVQVEGLEHLERAKAKHRGVLLMSGHFTIFDMMLPITAQFVNDVAYTYRPNDNPVIDAMIEGGRSNRADVRSFNKKQMRSFIRFIRKGGVGWYACDQDFKGYIEHFVPFFGVQTGAISMPSSIGKMADATVLFLSCARIGHKKYLVSFDDLGVFGDNPEKDAIRWNKALERAVKKHPEQYLWMHKRFKTRPEGEPKFYQ